MLDFLLKHPCSPSCGDDVTNAQRRRRRFLRRLRLDLIVLSGAMVLYALAALFIHGMPS